MYEKLFHKSKKIQAEILIELLFIIETRQVKLFKKQIAQFIMMVKAISYNRSTVMIKT